MGEYRVGLISDTHGVVRPAALAAFEGCDQIVHAGDIGRPEVLTALRSVAPVTAVRGNMDHDAWARRLPRAETVEVGQVLLYIVHDRARIDLDPAAAGIDAVISGHTHRAEVTRRNGVLYVNPGPAGPVTGSRSPSVALLRIRGRELQVEPISLPV